MCVVILILCLGNEATLEEGRTSFCNKLPICDIREPHCLYSPGTESRSKDVGSRERRVQSNESAAAHPVDRYKRKIGGSSNALPSNSSPRFIQKSLVPKKPDSTHLSARLTPRLQATHTQISSQANTLTTSPLEKAKTPKTVTTARRAGVEQARQAPGVMIPAIAASEAITSEAIEISQSTVYPFSATRSQGFPRGRSRDERLFRSISNQPITTAEFESHKIATTRPPLPTVGDPGPSRGRARSSMPSPTLRSTSSASMSPSAQGKRRVSFSFEEGSPSRSPPRHRAGNWRKGILKHH